MIDEAVLARLVDEAGDSIEVPLEGPARILAARPSRPSRRSGRPPWGPAAAGLGAVALVTLLAVLAANGSTSGKVSSGGRSATAGTSAAALPQGKSAAALPAGAHSAAGSGASTAGATAAGSPPAQPGDASPSEVVGVPARVIKTGTIDLSLGSGGHGLEDTLNQITARADGYGGYVSASSVQAAASGPASTGSVTVRVPAGDFDPMVAYVRGLGVATSVSTSGQDVTSTYVDMQARITALQDARAQFEQILARASTIGDILSVENQIDDLESQVEQLQGQLQLLSDQTSFSTLTVALAEPVVPGPVVRPHHSSGVSKAWQRARHDFAHGLEAVIGSLGGIAVFLLVAGALLLVGRLVWRYARRWLV